MLKDLNEQISLLKLELADTKAEHENTCMTLNEKLRMANEKCANNSALLLEIQELKADQENQDLVHLQNMKNINHEYEEKIRALDAEIAELKNCANQDEKISRLELELQERDTKIQEIEEAYQNSLQCLKSLNENLISDKNSTKIAHEEKMSEFLVNYEIVCEKLNNAEADKQAQQARINQLENQCKLYEETVVVESEVKSGDEKYEKIKAELEYECGVADDLKKQLQRVVDEREEMARNVAQLNEWWHANSVSLEQHDKLVDQLKEETSSAVKERDELSELVEKLKTQISETRVHEVELENRFKNEAKEVRESEDDLKVKLQAARMTMESLEAVKIDLEEKLDNSTGRIRELEEVLDKVQGKIDDLTTSREKAMTQNEIFANKVF